MIQGLDQLGPGIAQGLNIRAMMMRMQQDQQQQQARAAAGRALMGPQFGAPAPPGMGAPQPPMPGQSSAPAQPQPQPQPPMMSADPTEMGSMGGFNGAPGLPQPMQPMMPPDPTEMGAPPPQPTGAGGDPLTGAAGGTGNVVQDAQSTIMSIAQQIKAANPDIPPEQLYDATNLRIEQMRGVRDDVKNYMLSQVELAKVQTRLQVAEMQLQGKLGAAETAAGARVESANIGADSRRDVAGTQAGARVSAANIGADSRRDVAATGADARRYSADAGADSRVTASANDANARMYGADQSYRGRVDSASAMTKPLPTSRPVAKPVIQNRNTRQGAPSSNGRGSSYTPDSLKAAVASGKLTRVQGEKIARDNGWIR